MSAQAGTGTYSPAAAARDKRRERKEELRRHLAEDADWPRADGRSFHDYRPAFMETGPTTAASGSAYVEFGKTKVIVLVFGPRESKKAMVYSDVGRFNCNVSYTTFATPVRGQGAYNKEYSSMLHKALEGAVGSYVFLKSWRNQNKKVALGTILGCDPKLQVGGAPLGKEFWMVRLGLKLVPDEPLIRPYSNFVVIGDIDSSPIAWPSSCAIVGTDETGPRQNRTGR